MTQIADYVMSSGLGLGALDASRPLSPPSPSSATFAKASTSNRTIRRSTSGPVGGRGENRSSFTSTTQPNLMPGQPLMSSKDIHVIFANLEEIASLAESFAGLLDHAAGGGEEETEDRIGDTFLELVSRIGSSLIHLHVTDTKRLCSLAPSNPASLLNLLRSTPPRNPSLAGTRANTTILLLRVQDTLARSYERLGPRFPSHQTGSTMP